MKECPVCKAGSFDDAEVCYGCLHRFDPGQNVQATLHQPVSGAPSGAAASLGSKQEAPAVMEVPALAVARPAASAAASSMGETGRSEVLASGASPGAPRTFGAAMSVEGPSVSVPAPAQADQAAAACVIDDLAIEEARETQLPSGQLISASSQSGEIVLRIELHDVRDSPVRADARDRRGDAARARACARFHQGSPQGARVEVRYPDASERAAGMRSAQPRDRESRSRHAASPRHAQASQRDLCAVGA